MDNGRTILRRMTAVLLVPVFIAGILLPLLHHQGYPAAPPSACHCHHHDAPAGDEEMVSRQSSGDPWSPLHDPATCTLCQTLPATFLSVTASVTVTELGQIPGSPGFPIPIEPARRIARRLQRARDSPFFTLS